MKQKRLTYKEPVMSVLTYDEMEIFTLTVSTEYDPDRWENGNIPGIGDFLEGQ